MKFLIVLIQIMSLLFIQGCSSKGEPINRFLYGAGQSYDQKQCVENPTAKCGNNKSYEQYKREREELLKAENPVNKVDSGNLALHTCLYPGKPVNWVLRYCAIEYQTDDEIFLRTTPCFEKALADLHSKGNACQIKENYKRHYCKVLVEKYHTRDSVTLCLEDHSIKPFFVGNSPDK